MAQVKNKYFYRSKHTKFTRNIQHAGKLMLWGAALFTMIALILIVGFIVINGFYTRKVQKTEFTPLVEQIIPLDETGAAGMSILVNDGLHINDLTYDELRSIYQGLTPFWGYLSGQNINIRTAVYNGTGFRRRCEEYLLGENGSFGPKTAMIGEKDELISMLKGEKGGIALVPAEWGDNLKGVKRIGLRQLSVAVHPGIVQLQAGRRLDTLEPGQLQGILEGRIRNWSEIGGPSVEIDPADLSSGYEGVYDQLPVRLVVFDEGAPILYRLQSELLPNGRIPASAIRVSSAEEFSEAIRETPGAVGLVRRKEALEYKFTTLNVERVRGARNLRLSFLFAPPSRAGAVGGISYIIINTLAMVLFVIIIATPIGVAAAIYLVEYAKQGRLLNILRIGTDTLAGVPSIIFGLFGMVFFSQFLGFQTGLLSGTLTLTIMILPTIVRTSEEALRSVPNDLREGSLALGATKLQTIINVVLPTATPGILTGVILGIGRAIGETAAILFTLGSNLSLIRSFNSPIRVMSVHLYMLIRENISLPNAFATATILVIIVFAVNFTTRKLIGRMNKRTGRME